MRWLKQWLAKRREQRMQRFLLELELLKLDPNCHYVFVFNKHLASSSVMSMLGEGIYKNSGMKVGILGVPGKPKDVIQLIEMPKR